MPYTEEEKAIISKRMFGMTTNDLDAQIKNTLELDHFSGGPAMLAVSVLSDAQELLNLGHMERAQQLINQSKYILIEFVKIQMPINKDNSLEER
jgi:hypothetical protein